jgi:predicted secreted protein
MTWFTGLMVYVILWWLIWFTLLPVGVRVPDKVEQGHADSAPANPRLWLKALAATLIAGLLWGAMYYAIQSDWISFRAE